MSILSLLPDYEIYLKHERRLSAATIAAYLCDLRVMSRSLPQPISEITLDDLRAYQRHLSMSDLKVATVRRKFHGFSTFWKWARLEGHCMEVVTERIKLPRQDVTIPRWLNADELQRFVSTPIRSDSYQTRLRHGLAFKTLAWLGLRRAELLKLLISNVYLETDTIIVRNTKSKRDRAMPIPAPLRPAFAELIAERPGDDYVFSATSGEPWGVQPFAKAFKRHLAACGLAGQGITPHTLRHTFATHLVMRGVPITDVKELLGHSDIKNTMIYVHANPDRLRHAMNMHILNGAN